MAKPGDGWTLDTLRIHLQRQIDDRVTLTDERHKANQEAVQAALQAAKEAVAKAETAMDKRFDGVNEFRQTLSDQAASFPTRAEMKAEVEKVAAEATRNTTRLAELELRLTTRLDTSQGAASGGRQVRDDQRLNISAIIAALAAAAAVATLILLAFKH